MSPEIVWVRCEACGAEWDPRERLLGTQGCPNALDHPVVHRLRRRAATLESRLRRVCVYADNATAQGTDEWGQPTRLWAPRGVWSRRRSPREGKR